MEEFWLEAKASVVNVETDSDRGGDVLVDAISQRFITSLWNANRFKLTLYVSLVLAIVVENGAEDLPQLLRRNISSARYGLAFTVQEGCCGPSSHVVPSIYIWALVSVNPYRDEVFVYHVDYSRVGVGSVVHDMAPVAPRALNVEKDGLSRGFGLLETLTSPFEPVDPVQLASPTLPSCSE